MPGVGRHDPMVSAVICTRNRPDVVGQAVASVLASAYAPFDLTVIDQSTTDATACALQATVAVDSEDRGAVGDEPLAGRVRDRRHRR